MKTSLTGRERDKENERVQRAWRKQASSYDNLMGWFERRVFGLHNRPWICSRAKGEVLEVAVGSGLNFPHYPPDVELAGIDLSPEMLAIAEQRAAELGLKVDLDEGDAHELDFDDESFDTVVCTFSLCNIPDPRLAVSEMKRVLRPGGRLLLLDHIRSSNKIVYWLQRIWEFFSIRLDGDHQTRRPLEHVQDQGFTVVESDRFRWGIVERLHATKP